jgi:hypothetical protein
MNAKLCDISKFSWEKYRGIWLNARVPRAYVTFRALFKKVVV